MVKSFTSEEQHVLDTSISILVKENSPFASIVSARVKDVEQLATIVDRAPSPNTDLLQQQDVRNANSLVRKLTNHGVGHVVDLPTKAVLGHGLTVSKLHLFGLLMKLLPSIKALQVYRYDIEKEYNDLLFTLMAEDLYTAIVSDSELDTRWVEEAAMELITMWDLRTSGYMETFALAIRGLWQARQSIAPTLGTLMGTIEIMKLSALLPPVWIDFLSTISNGIEVGYALEEFLFDLHYEEIVELRSKMAFEKLIVIDRQEAWAMLGKEDLISKEQNMALALYKSYMARHHKAKMRSYRKDAGPKRSLEEYFVIYLLASDEHISTVRS